MKDSDSIDVECVDENRLYNIVEIVFSALDEDSDVYNDDQPLEWRGEDFFVVARVRYDDDSKSWEVRVSPDGDNYRIRLGKGVFYNGRNNFNVVGNDEIEDFDEWEVETIEQINEVLNDIDSLSHRNEFGQILL